MQSHPDIPLNEASMRILSVFIATLLLSLAPSAYSFTAGEHEDHKAAPASSTSSEKAPSWKKVESEKVCMVTDMLFERKQIPVKVADTTYYGCCENCKARLSEDASVRKAIDPISGKSVDKSKASIGRDLKETWLILKMTET